MRWGRKWGKKWGFCGTPPTTVEVMIINGVYTPCKSCHWFTVCIVPKGKHHQVYDKQRIRDVYRCEDYVDRNAINVADWDKL